jgi:nucleotide-binding universal stress UspA family protein
MPEMPVVVGVDGSASARIAAEWAADEAARRHAALSVVHAYPWPLVHVPDDLLPVKVGPQIREDARLMVAEVVAELQSRTPGLVITSDVVATNPVDLLVDESKRAQLVVVGSHGHGGVREMMIGSVAAAMSAHGHSPVVVVRGPTPYSEPPTEGPVVVGADGSPHSRPAIAYAFATADRLGAPLIALHTWSDVNVEAPYGSPYWQVDWDAVQEDERRVLAEQLAGWQQDYPDVKVDRIVTRDRPVRSLLDAAQTAQLVVVGCRGRGGFTGMLLGSTSRALIHHCPCPVAIVRNE